MKKPILFSLVAALAVLLLFIAVNRSVDTEGTHQSLIDLIKVHQQVEGFDTESLRLQDISAVPVEIDGKAFKVTTRRDKMMIQNCSSCHEGPLADNNKAFWERKGHWEIANPHGNAENVNCTTCHNQGDVNRLNVGMVKTVGFDESFRLCATCHFKEFKDWSGGAHGKRVVGWAGEKIINNCTACHNPHSSKFPTRRPAIMSPVPPVPE